MTDNENTTTTPTKIITRLTLPDRTNETICTLCGNTDIKADIRRKLYSSLPLQKTTTCVNLELLLGHDIDSEVSTNIVCRNCAEKNAKLVKKLKEVRSKFNATKEKISAEKESSERIVETRCFVISALLQLA